MFNKIKLAIAKAAPMLFTAYAIVEEPDEVAVEAPAETEEQETPVEKPSVTDNVKKVASTVTKIFMETVPVKEETPMDLASQVIDSAFTATVQATITGAVAMFTAKHRWPMRAVYGIVAFASASMLANKWKDEIVHPKTTEYMAKGLQALGLSHTDPEFQIAAANLYRPDATAEEKQSAFAVVLGSAFPTAKDARIASEACDHDRDKLIDMAERIVIAKGLEEAKFYTEFLSKPFVEQKWFVKTKNWFKKMKEPFADPEVRHSISKMLRGLGFGLCLTCVATLAAGPAWPIVFFTGLAASCGLMASEMTDNKVKKVRNFLAGAAIYIAEIVISFDIIKSFTAAKESVCNA